MNFFAGSLVVLMFILIIALNIGILYLLIKRAIRKYVKPTLNQKGLVYVNYRAINLFGSGDFKGEDKRTFTPIVSTGGSPSIDIFFYVFYKSGDLTKRVTVKVETTLLFIRKVKYSREL
ncbi:hypothetical protein [Mucilaginibacter sp.]|uniref:hypothetical protein n=1 Tax=Mucilaginibacter sp. TaxID=1882438 RepID=UPI0025F7875F|nr:hypothetical protein [Mucilaginibacter sp.]